MRFAQVAAAFVLICAALSAPACQREPRTQADAIGMLRSPDANERKDAANKLRKRDPMPPEAVPHLFAAIQVEQNPEAYDAMLLALGASGAAEAKPLIDARIND